MCRLRDQLRVPRQGVRTAFVIVWIKKTLIFGEFVHCLADRLTCKAVCVENCSHLAFDASHFAQTKFMHLIRLQFGGRVLVQLVGVEGVAIRQFPDAIVCCRFWQDCLEIID